MVKETIDIMQTIVDTEIERISPELRNISLDLHKNPETGLEEHHAHDVLTKYLEKNGFEVTRHAFGMETAFMAKFTNGAGPRIGFCSEYDALPGLGHACGHNLIAISGVASAMGLKALLDAGNAKGTVVLFGTPSEERLEGKIIMARKGAFQDNVDVCSMLHPAPNNMTYWGATACNYATIEYRGKPSHAGGAPWNGVNALDAICQAWVSVGLLRQQLLGTDRVHGVITDGGKAPNVIPDYTSASIGVRAPTSERVEVLMKKVENCFNAAALATGCKVDIKWRDTSICKNITQNSVMAEMYASYHEKYGGQSIASRQVQEAAQVGGSTDFGNVSVLVPGIHPFFAIETDDFPHTKDFASSAETTKAHDATMRASKSLAMVNVHILEEKQFFDKTYQEFEATIPKEKRIQE
ncbi:hypothetical protein BDA99DRAFT_575829 [Phascolomyces articulosus]|uniref:Peptidase M20 domain-containing protein 2 n=1 Tax=Phascolomyces articulosus TaxID=60185 RepID=A0AAD5P8Z5_9FUNG|nr:hypothetical protein BDA99DRAFT_575829 [Phascolomyces articulosus]